MIHIKEIGELKAGGRMILLPQLLVSYIGWHYTVAFVDMWRIYTNLSWFLFNFFSVRILLSTFFAPWKRLRESGKGDEGALGALIINPITRFVGVLVRSVTVGTGLFSLLILLLFFFAAVVCWLLMPLILFGLFAQSVKWIF